MSSTRGPIMISSVHQENVYEEILARNSQLLSCWRHSPRIISHLSELTSQMEVFAFGWWWRWLLGGEGAVRRLLDGGRRQRLVCGSMWWMGCGFHGCKGGWDLRCWWWLVPGNL
ncbi:uncharacterized protein LOC131308897 [Rhododendron vialii]|uniref:uncharacterized protein LOC131308897 n=1 Tax=Rhododendron vialii TaxID=182163 RepID=UPI00265E5165|nr:uncharacterized protein LOC131308897 [Rhododendron vialii]